MPLLQNPLSWPSNKWPTGLQSFEARQRCPAGTQNFLKPPWHFSDRLQSLARSQLFFGMWGWSVMVLGLPTKNEESMKSGSFWGAPPGNLTAGLPPPLPPRLSKTVVTKPPSPSILICLPSLSPVGPVAPHLVGPLANLDNNSQDVDEHCSGFCWGRQESTRQSW